MKRYHRIFFGLLALWLLLSLLPLQAFAATTEDPKTDEEVTVAESAPTTVSALITALGFCGENVTWVLDSDGTLTISGNGPMTDYQSKDSVPWVSYQSRIQKVIIEDGVTHIGNYSFAYCSYLKSVIMTDDVCSIGQYAMMNCSLLDEITLSNSLTKISAYTFSYCTKLTSIYIPQGVTVVDYGAFSGCRSLSEIRGMESVSIIGSYAFSRCNALTKFTVSNRVTQISTKAFYDCRNLKEITIPSSVTSIGSEVFDRCISLSKITFEGSAPSLASDAFTGISAVIVYPAEDSSWDSVAGNNFGGTEIFWSNDGKINLTGRCGKGVSWYLNEEGILTISGSGNMDGYEVYYGCDCDVADIVRAPWYSWRESIRQIIIKDGVTSIGTGVFMDCENVVQVTIPDSISEISSSAFIGCAGLTSIDIPDGVTYIAGNAFNRCSNLISVTIGSGVQKIGWAAFSYCSNLEDVYIRDLSAWCTIDFENRSSNPLFCGTNLYVNDQMVVDLVIPEDITSIGKYAFYDWNSLNSVSIPTNITTVGKSAFTDCINLQTVNLSAGLTTIQTEAFSGCTAITNINIPDTVACVGASAFKGCKQLNAVEIGSLKAWCEIQFENPAANPLSYAGNLYINDQLVVDLVIPEDITSIGKYAFYGSNSMTNLTIDSHTTSVDVYAFAYCKSLKNVSLPEGTPTLSEGMFRGCSNLTDFTIPYGVVTIDTYAFGDCSGLERINIPESVTQLGNYAFYGCSGLESINIPESVTQLGSYAFYGCNGLESINIPKSVTRFGNYAFYGCRNLSAVYISDLKAWCETTFSNRYANPLCYGGKIYLNDELITDLAIPEDVVTIGRYAFIGCNALSSISIPKTVTTIGESAFADCKNLKMVVLPEETTLIESSAFYGCNNLWHVLYTGTATKWLKLKVGTDNDGLYDTTVHFSANGNDILVGKETCTYKEHFICTICNDILREDKSKGAHTYSSERDTTCNTCGEVRKVAPAAPVIKISSVDSTGNNQVTWEKAAGAEKYKVYRSTSKTGAYTCVLTTSNLSYTHTTGQPGTRYYYYVVAVDAEGMTSGKSNILSRTCDLPAPKISVSNAASSGKIKVSWEKIDGAKEYKIYRADSKNGEYKLMKTTTETSYTNTSAVAGKVYYYKVVAVHANSAANSAYSEIKSRTCDLPRPVVTASNVASSGKIKLTWKKVDGAVQYKVYRATTKSGKYKLMKTTTDTSYTNTSVDAGKTYYYKIVAVHDNKYANSVYSEIKSRTADLARPDVFISLSSGKPKVSWKKVDGAVKYEIYRATSKNGTYSLVKTTTGGYYKDTTSKSGKTYYYKVVAVCSNTAGNSAYSKVVSIKSTK